MILLTLFIASAALLTSCSHRQAMRTGEVTTVAENGERLCISTTDSDGKPTSLCGNLPADYHDEIKVGDCFEARHGPRHEGRFTDVQFAGACSELPAE